MITPLCAAAHLLTRDEARRIAANIAKSAGAAARYPLLPSSTPAIERPTNSDRSLLGDPVNSCAGVANTRQLPFHADFYQGPRPQSVPRSQRRSSALVLIEFDPHKTALIVARSLHCSTARLINGV